MVKKAHNYWWTFTLDAHGSIKDPIRPVEEKKFMNMKHSLAYKCRTISTLTEGHLHLIFDRASDTIYYFQNQQDAEKSLKNIVK